MLNCANRARSLSLSGGIAARALATCGRPAALVGVGPCPIKAHCASGTAVSLGARPCSDMPATASKREAYLRTCACQTTQTARTLSLSQEESQHARFRRARAPPRWFELAHTLWNPTAPAGRPSPLVHGRAPTCQPRPSNEQLTCVRAQVKQSKPRTLSRSLSQEESQHARFRRARARPRWLESVHALWKPTAPAGLPSPSVHSRAPTC